MVEKDRHKGDKGALIVAQGPSIQKPSVMREIRSYAKKGWTVFGIKEAIGFLKEKGLPVHYSVAMDPASYQVGRTPVYEDVIYCIASSCHPELFDHCINGGARVEVFHSACGYYEVKMQAGAVIELGLSVPGKQDEDGNILVEPKDFIDQAVVPGELEMKTVNGSAFSPVFSVTKDEVTVYNDLFENADVVVGGFTVGNRALGLAKYMGFDKVVMAGMDFGWREGVDEHYATFVKYAGLTDVFMSDNGRVDGKPWKTRPDLLASAVDVARFIKTGKVKVLGDSLAVSLSKKDDVYLDNVVQVAG